ncbi:hypothetical protein FDUTEX481_01631 [Tolypothrix sp. PCC 7601]|nr:hypothetical protein FDUTEX481_01631 [Tolypothrix sp. PCC 7601]
MVTATVEIRGKKFKIKGERKIPTVRYGVLNKHHRFKFFFLLYIFYRYKTSYLKILDYPAFFIKITKFVA